MAVSDIYNSLTFGGINSLDYGIYISGPGVYDAPTRAVEFVSVPGRNGDIEIDQGHWNNIEVSYTAGVFAGNQEDFGRKINAFRNAIVSQVGYQRLTDTYNADEYRLGIYASGMDASTVKTNEAGEFDLIFNCKPQRYLLDGENEIDVTSGDTITNPTLYEAGPLLSVWDFGEIILNGQSIQILSEAMGRIELAESETIQGDSISFEVPNTMVNSGDPITIPSSVVSATIRPESTGFTIVNTTLGSDSSSFARSKLMSFGGGATSLITSFDEFEFVCGTSATYSNTITVEVTVRKRSDGTVSTGTTTSVQEISYDGTSGVITISQSVTDAYGTKTNRVTTRSAIYANSSVSILGNPIYVDCEIGDVYKMEGSDYVDLNAYVALPSDLPKLKPGENEITFDNTITDLKITPRWWEL